MDAIRKSKPIATVSAATVAAGSVWETRRKINYVRDGIKVSNGDDPDTINTSRDGGGVEEDSEQVPATGNGSPIPAKRNNGLRKTWKSDPVKELKSHVQVKKAVERKSPVQGIRRLRSEAAAKSNNGNSSPELRKVKSELLRKAKSQPESFSSVSKAAEKDGNGGKEVEEEVEEEEKDKVVLLNPDQGIKSDPIVDESDAKVSNGVDDGDGEFSDYDEEDEELGDEIEKKTNEVKKTIIAEPKPISPNLSKQNQAIEKPKPIIASTVNKQSSASSSQIKPAVSTRIQRITSTSSSPTTKPITSNVHKPSSPATKQSSTVLPRYPKRDSYAYERFPETQNKLQNLVDLVMWRDASKSAFVFGIGSFTIISSSYTKEVNISFVSVTSYLGLVYLAAIFLYRSIICRGYVDIQYKGNVLGEEEAIWLLRLMLPYLNEFLLKIKALFSGDPATTMKLAVLLFVLAKCGSSITIWNMAKLGFFGVFTVPKVCCAYSTQFTAYGNFWMRRFKDVWDSCSHKKAAAFAIFTLVWNFSSVVARIWTVFLLFVAVRYYQQSLMREDWVEDEKDANDTTQPRTVHGPTFTESLKERKLS